MDTIKFKKIFYRYVLTIFLLCYFVFIAGFIYTVSQKKQLPESNKIDWAKVNKGATMFDARVAEMNATSTSDEERVRSAIILSGGVLKFAGKDFTSYYITPINKGLAMYYSADELNFSAKTQLIINQYGNNISAKDLADGIIEQSKQEGFKIFQPFIAPDAQKRESYYITSYATSSGTNITDITINVIKVFEDNKSTYSLIFSQNLEANSDQEAEQLANKWLLDNLEQYGTYLDNLDISKNIEFYNQNEELHKELSKSNKYQSLKWQNKITKEENVYADVNIAYPKFIGGFEVQKLNELIKSTVDKILADDRAEVKDWIDNGFYTTDGNGNKQYYDDSDADKWECRDAKEYDYQCSVNLRSSYEINSITNDIVSIKIIFSDYTGGGNGNHDHIVVINYDLKNNQEVKNDKLFCREDYLNKIVPIVRAEIYAQHWGPNDNWDNEIDEYTAPSSENYKNIGIGGLGISVYFQPYTVSSGAAGVVEAFVPYSDLIGDICLP